MPDHVFGDEHGGKNLAVVHAEREADESRRDHRATRPSLDRRLGFSVFGLLDFILKMEVHERTFFDRASHKLRYLFFIGRPSRRTRMKRLEYFFLVRVR